MGSLNFVLLVAARASPHSNCHTLCDLLAQRRRCTQTLPFDCLQDAAYLWQKRAQLPHWTCRPASCEQKAPSTSSATSSATGGGSARDYVGAGDQSGKGCVPDHVSRAREIVSPESLDMDVRALCIATGFLSNGRGNCLPCIATSR